MSQKINSKNLTYDSFLPPFLARLRGQQQAEHSGGPDPILAAHRRPGQKRSASEEAEDAPVVVDEEGNVVDFPTIKESDNDKDINKESGGAEKGEDDSTNKDKNEVRGTGGEGEKEKVAGIGASRKRKVGRVVGEQSDDEDGNNSNSNSNPNSRKHLSKPQDDEARIAKASADIRRLVDGDKHQDEDRGTASKAVEKKQSQEEGRKQQQKEKTTVKSAKKKTAKKIKLSFGDDGD